MAANAHTARAVAAFFDPSISKFYAGKTMVASLFPVHALAMDKRPCHARNVVKKYRKTLLHAFSEPRASGSPCEARLSSNPNNYILLNHHIASRAGDAQTSLATGSCNQTITLRSSYSSERLAVQERETDRSEKSVRDTISQYLRRYSDCLTFNTERHRVSSSRATRDSPRR